MSIEIKRFTPKRRERYIKILHSKDWLLVWNIVNQVKADAESHMFMLKFQYKIDCDPEDKDLLKNTFEQFDQHFKNCVVYQKANFALSVIEQIIDATEVIFTLHDKYEAWRFEIYKIREKIKHHKKRKQRKQRKKVNF